MNPQRPLYRLDPVPYWESRIAAVWKESGSALDRVLRMQQLLAEMGDARDAASMDQRDRQWLNEARSRLEAHAANPDAVQAVAGEMGMSYQVFRKTFSRLHGCGPFRFCSERRMQLAAGRLLTDSVPVKALAAELGYCDEFHFSRRFRQIHGVSPDAYRRRMHAQDRSARQD